MFNIINLKSSQYSKTKDCDGQVLSILNPNGHVYKDPLRICAEFDSSNSHNLYPPLNMMKGF
jgi:hypothetical protein